MTRSAERTSSGSILRVDGHELEIRLTRQVHLPRLPAHPRGAPTSGDDDF